MADFKEIMQQLTEASPQIASYNIESALIEIRKKLSNEFKSVSNSHPAAVRVIDALNNAIHWAGELKQGLKPINADKTKQIDYYKLGDNFDFR